MLAAFARVAPLVAVFAASVVVAAVPPVWEGEPDDLNGDWELISTIPPEAAETIREEERALGSGNWADRAWTLTKGRDEVRIAVLDSGIEWDEKDLLYTAFLNLSELGGDKLPRVDRATPVTGAVFFAGMDSDCTTWPGALSLPADGDANGDGVFNLEDYLCDGRVDRTAGVDAADHLVDPSDLIAIFSDGVDDDGNGYVDDISGWDVFWNDNDPYDDTRYGHGTGEAKDSTAEGNNGESNIGVCPGCRHVPVRVGDSFITDVHSFADGVLYGLAVDAKVIQEALGTLNMNQRAQDAVELAWQRGVVTIASAADEMSLHQNWPGSGERMVYTHAVAFDGINGIEGSTTFLNFSNCTNGGIRLELSAAAGSCSSGAVGRTSGVAGLIYSAGLDAGLDPALDAAEVAQLLKMTVDDIAYADSPTNHTRYPTRPGWDLWTGYGRVNAYKAVKAVFAGEVPPTAEIVAPGWFEIVDPSGGGRLEVAFEAAARRSTAAEWTLEVAPGGDVSDGMYRELRRGSVPAAGARVELTIPFSELPVDPVAGVPDGIYGHAVTLRLRVRDAEGRLGEGRKVFHLRSDPRALPGFPKKLAGSLDTSPKLVDFDGDGRLWIVQASSDGSLHVFDGLGLDRPGFPVPLPTRFHGPAIDPTGDRGRSAPLGTPAVGDLDGDGRTEIVVVDLDGHVTAWDDRGRIVPGFPVEIRRGMGSETNPDTQLEDGFFASPVLADFEGDGRLSIVAAGMDGAVHVYDHQGRTRPGFPVPVSDPDGGRLERLVATPAVGDLDGNGDLEIVLGSNEYFWHDNDFPVATVRLYAIHADGLDAPGGPFLRGWPLRLSAVLPDVLPYIGRGNPNGVVLGDWDGKPGLEILTAPLTGMPAIYDHAGREVRRLSLGPWGEDSASLDFPGMIPIIHPSAGDLDGDGTPDPVIPLSGAGYFLGAGFADGQRIPADHLMAAWSGKSGRMFAGMPVKVDDWQFFGNPSIADVDGDGRLEILGGSGLYRVHAYDLTGKAATGFPKNSFGWVIATPAVGDLDGDGLLEVVVGTREGWLWAWRTEAPAAYPDGRSALSWPEYHRTGHNNANLSLPIRSQPGPKAESAAGCGVLAAPTALDAAPWLLLLGVWAALRRRRPGTRG